jgi:hypothetical protein
LAQILTPDDAAQAFIDAGFDDIVYAPALHQVIVPCVELCQGYPQGRVGPVITFIEDGEIARSSLFLAPSHSLNWQSELILAG